MTAIAYTPEQQELLDRMCGLLEQQIAREKEFWRRWHANDWYFQTKDAAQKWHSGKEIFWLYETARGRHTGFGYVLDVPAQWLGFVDENARHYWAQGKRSPSGWPYPVAFVRC